MKYKIGDPVLFFDDDYKYWMKMKQGITQYTKKGKIVYIETYPESIYYYINSNDTLYVCKIDQLQLDIESLKLKKLVKHGV